MSPLKIIAARCRTGLPSGKLDRATALLQDVLASRTRSTAFNFSFLYIGRGQSSDHCEEMYSTFTEINQINSLSSHHQQLYEDGSGGGQLLVSLQA